MAIEKNNLKVSRLDSECVPDSRESMSSDEDDVQGGSSAVESDEDDEFDEADSGAGSDEFDFLELGETGTEFCRFENQTCSVPFELYDLPGLEDILSVDVWNDCLSEDERFSLTKYLPDMDQEMFMRSLMELFTGGNFHFGSPIKKLFDMLKGGLCEPRVALYRQGLNFFQKRQHYHLIKKHQNNIVSSLCQVRDALSNCKGYSIEERLRVFNIMRSQKSLMCEKLGETDESEQEASDEGLWGKKMLTHRVAEQNVGHHSAYGVALDSEFPLRGRAASSKLAKYGKQNPKGILKLADLKTPSSKRESATGFPPVHRGSDRKSDPYGSAITLPQQSRPAGYGSGLTHMMRDQIRDADDDEDTMFGMGLQRDRDVSRGSMIDKVRVLKVGKKREPLRVDENSNESLMRLHLSSKNDMRASGTRNRNVNHFSEVRMLAGKPHNMGTSFDYEKKTKYPDNVQQFVVGDRVKSEKERAFQLTLKGTRVDLTDRAEPIWHNREQGGEFSVDSSYDDLNARSKKWTTGKESAEFFFKSVKAPSPRMNDKFLHSEFRAKQSNEKIRGNLAQNGGPDIAALEGNRMFHKSEETESDSSEQLDDDDDDDSNPLIRSKLSYPDTIKESRSFSKSSIVSHRAKYVKKDMKENEWAVDGIPQSSRKTSDLDDQIHMPELHNHSSKAKKKSKVRDMGPLENFAIKTLEDSCIPSSGKYNDDRKRINRLGKNDRLLDPNGMLHMSSSKKRQKVGVGHDHSVSHPNDLQDYAAGEEHGSIETQLLADDIVRRKVAKKGLNLHAKVNGHPEPPLLGCNSVTKKKKKKKGKGDVADIDSRDEICSMQSEFQQQIDDLPTLKRKGKRKVEAYTGTPDRDTSELPVADMGITDVEMETKPQKKPFTLITPTHHTNFSFSIIHLLSAVRMAMITPTAEDSLEPREEQNIKPDDSVHEALCHENMDVVNREHTGQVNVPSLTVHEIVNRVRSNPGDPCILETQEPLQDLVRGVLKIFSSKTAPLGAKGWKAIVVYDRTTKCWNWTGPVANSSSDHETFEEVTSPDSWGLPHKMLVKLVDSFANWLKSGQDTLQQIGSLPAPPTSLRQFNLDDKERFRDLRAQKSLNTIGTSTEEVRAYFHKEENLRYSIPDRAFSYTAADGKKSIVAPLRRCGGKPTSKARDHFMLKRDRPPHVTILCLVRDAAARLPGSIGTRADVCTLIRDSQYIVDNVSDAQVNQVVSGALDRLHYERDPCVQFDGERKLWVYLHRDREEEDFEDDCTSSTKKWKRPKRDTADQSDLGSVTVPYLETAEQSGFDGKGGVELMDNDVRQNVEENIPSSLGLEQGNIHLGDSIASEVVNLNHMYENKLLCQENSTNEDFDDDHFS